MIPITPETKIAALLEAFPGLDEQLAARVPAFAKLRNPVLRRTVAKVATVEHAARIAGLAPHEFITWLRELTGQPAGPANALAPPADEPAPEWLDTARVAARLDAEDIIAAAGHPLGEVRKALDRLEGGAILELVSPFPPLPLVDALRRSGHAAWTRSTPDGRFVTYLRRAA